ncbi:ABC transporter transmembrane domain-containing protein [Phaeobacter gallaeciensis]|uniref:ABC transporter transmembrane domain-containing protein n=1 Tax=Phaeobacter gallaeciensis TaxID=60890 RepID=UPI000BBC908E|nr:ABC transporter transmembrane domain-containing protein [Phaeobacter gallaeciensis]ATF20288.1 ABC-type bacteriocin/lantibiotic exporter [Phaeobacter gallaeciensis]ATF24397.1 ABC-type bacteriocin/lantibiotic exporter [Phaeobacter gallaeciensis]
MSLVTTQNAGALLKELLLVGGWQNNKEAITEAFPYLTETLDTDDLIQTLENLDVPYTRAACLENEITNAECPALVIPDHGNCYVALRRNGALLQIAGLDGEHPGTLEARPNPCTVIRIEKFSFQPARQEHRTVGASFAALRQMIPGLLLAGFLTNLLGLLAPLLIMAIYDRVIPSGSVDLLVALVAGVVILATSDFLFRSVRTRALAYVGQQGERALAVALFGKLMSLPLSQLQKSSVSQQIARFRQFESLRELFTGQVMTTLIDLPFALMFFAVLTYLAPSVGLLTLGLAVLLMCIGVLAMPFQQRLDQTAAEASRASSAVLQDAVEHQRTLANLGMQEQWLRRCMPLAEASETATARARQLRNLIQSVSQSIVALGSVGAIILCAHGAVAGSISFGALIASIALVSKVLAPVQAFQASLGQIAGFRKSQRQANQVLSLTEEMELGLNQSHQKTLRGAISFQGVSYRPDPLNPALLTAAAFDCAPGELVVIMGRDTASRTAVLDLASGLASPSSGVIEHDGIDIRQIARDELRKSITYSTYMPKLFHGTVVQNFRLAAPALSEAEIHDVLEHIGISEEIKAMPDGCSTRLSTQFVAGQPGELIKALALARSMARQSSIFLFSEPTNDLSKARRDRFKKWLETQRGAKTVLIATADRSFMPMADRLIYLNGDRVIVNDTGPAAIKKVQAVMKAMGT